MSPLKLLRELALALLPPHWGMQKADKKCEGGSEMVVEVVSVDMGRVDDGVEVSTEKVSVGRKFCSCVRRTGKGKMSVGGL